MRALHLTVKGELDPSRLMGQPTENRTGFHAIELIADIDSDASPDELNEVLRLSELRCPVSDNVGAETPIVVRLAAQLQ